jgi:ATP-dependent exoDNAse (exonuclease V) alpha subunit
MKLPSQFDFVDTEDPIFSLVLDQLLGAQEHTLIQGAAGTGKSLLIKILASVKSGCVVLSTTGITALNLCTDDVKATTIHSFFLLPPVDIIPEDTTVSQKIIQNIQKAQVIVIDEVSMMSSQLFDAIVKKVVRLRKRGQGLPRFILFGDIMQLPPVVNLSNQHVRDFYEREYEGNVMFFNSKWFKTMGFKTLTLRRIYRQADPEYKQRLIEIGFNEATEDTLSYFNERKTTIQEYERDHPYYIKLSPTNNVVNNINAKYVSSFPGKPQAYTAKKFDWKGSTPNDETVILKPGIQVICLRNSCNGEDEDYRNGSLGVVKSTDSDGATVELMSGKTTRVGIHTQYQYVAELDGVTGDVRYVPRGQFTQIDCKPCKALTIHKAQGKSIDAVYLQLGGWSPEGLIYVALSRTPTIGGLGLSRELRFSDIKVNMESWKFLQEGDVETIGTPKEEEDWDQPVGDFS